MHRFFFAIPDWGSCFMVPKSTRQWPHTADHWFQYVSSFFGISIPTCDDTNGSHRLGRLHQAYLDTHSKWVTHLEMAQLGWWLTALFIYKGGAPQLFFWPLTTMN